MSASVKILALFMWILSGVSAQSADSVSRGKAPLRFDRQGRFKIAQFTDLHLKEDSQDDGQTVTLMQQILDMEKPQLVVLTEDLLASAKQSRQVMTRCSKPMAQHRIP